MHSECNIIFNRYKYMFLESINQQYDEETLGQIDKESEHQLPNNDEVKRYMTITMENEFLNVRSQ